MLTNSGLQMATLTTAVVFVMALVIPSGTAYFIPGSSEDVVKRAMELVRDKRYTDTQERASSFCTGMCMYEERKAYSDCFDLCNWNGRSPSPWMQLDKQRSGMDSMENSVEKMPSLLRTGVGKQKPSDKSKVRGRSGSKNAPSWDINY